MSNQRSEDIDIFLYNSHREVITQQFFLAKYGVPFEYTDKLSFKERELYLDILTEDIIPTTMGGNDAESQ